MYSWVKCSDEIQKHCSDLGELKEGDKGAGLLGDGEDEDDRDPLPPPPQQQPPQQQLQPPPQQQQQIVGGALAGSDSDKKSILVGGGVAAAADASSMTFQLKANQELRFEVKAESNQQVKGMCGGWF